MYRFSPQVLVEYFDDRAILFVAEHDLMVTVNRAAAELFETVRARLRSQPFTRGDCADLLLESYHLTPDRAAAETAAMLAFGLRNRIILKGAPIEPIEPDHRP